MRDTVVLHRWNDTNRRSRVGQIILAAGLLLGSVPLTAQAQVLFTDNFNTENSGNAALSFASFSQWNVTRGTVDLIGNGNFDLYPGNGLFVDMDGTSNAAGRLETKSAISLTPGNYTLSFSLGKNGNAQEDMTVSVGSAFSQSLSDALPYSSLQAKTFNFSVPGATTGTIVFDHAGGDNFGYVIDNVVLSRVTTAPEPAAVALLATGFVPIGVRASRRRKIV